ncbi:hypothetical protein SASPL_129099 [Salvia splendens]|uniref:Uncharacterized protein n=1 Tax=Salvia splendens TaxID=180675 RepID=A0A8X8XCI1_SALSN|nr:hypothetical protein SASPL_129099 [Salvia splendens]
MYIFCYTPFYWIVTLKRNGRWVHGLQRSTNEAEEVITDGFERLDQCLTQTIAGNTLTMLPDVNTYMTQMSIATKES